MKRPPLIFPIVVLLALFACGAMFATQPRLHTTYLPGQFATARDIESQHGFFAGETDAAGNRYVWTQEHATLVFDFLVHKPVTFTFTMRSAAVAGGPDQPVQVTVNGQAAGTLHPDPANPAFQAISLRLVPYDWGGQRTEIKLLPATFKPKGDNRTLGTMIQSISIDKGEAWSTISRRIWLLWALPVLALLALGCGWAPRRYRSSWTANGAVAFFLVGMGCAVALLALILRIGSIESDTSRVWVPGSACLALCFAAGAMSVPVDLLGGRSLFRWARERIASSPPFARARATTQPDAGVPRSNTGGRERREIGSLTGLRFIAVLLVYFSHLRYSDRHMPEVVRTFLFSGFDGVSIFFVLSGFVICYNYYDRMAENPRAHLWEYFVARFARLYPMYLLTFLWFFSSQNINHQLHASRSIILPNLTMTQAWSAKESIYFGYNPVSWSLSVEAFFYVIFPFLAFVLLKRLSRIWQLIVVGIVASCALLAAAMWFSVTKNLDFYGSPHYWLYQLPATRTGDFLLGCLAARIFVLRSAVPVTPREAKIGGSALLVCMLAIGVIMCINVPVLIPFRFGPVYAPFIVIAIYCLARYNTISSRVLSTKPLLLLGAASYSFYLIHGIVIDALSVPASAIGTQTAYLHDLLIFAVVTILSIGAYHYVEMPTRKFLRRFLTRQRSPGLQQSIVGRPGTPEIISGWQLGRGAGAVEETLYDGEPIPAAKAIQARDPVFDLSARLSLRQRHITAIVILAVISCIFFGSLFKGETYSDVASRQNGLYPWAATPHPRPAILHYDQADTYFPWQVFISHAFHRHEFPLWNPDSFLGQPFFANGQNSLLYPPRILLTALVPPYRVHDLLLLSHMLLGGVAMYFLLVRQRLSFAAALFGAVAWMLNSFMLVWMALETYLVIEAWLPVAFLLVASVVYRRSWLAAIGLGGVMALMFWGGSALFVEVTAITIGAYAAYLLLRPVWASRRRHGLTAAVTRVARKCLPLAASGLLFVGLIAVQALPTIELTAITTRAAYSLSQLTAPTGYHVVLSDLGSFFLPRRYPMVEIYHHLLFLGTPTAALALIGLFRRHPLARFARWLAIIALLLGLGTPLVAIPYHLVPGFNNLFLGRLMFLFAFGVAILAAFGLDLVIRKYARVPRWLYRSVPFVGSAIAWASRFIRSLVPRRTFVGLVCALLIGIVVLQMYTLSGDVNRHQPSDPAYLYPKTPIIEQLAQRGDVRILPIAPFFFTSDTMMFDMQRIGGYDSLVPARTVNLETVVWSGGTVQQVYNRPVDGPFIETFQVPYVQLQYTQRLGITDVLTPPTIISNPWWTANAELAKLDLKYAGPDGRDYTVRDTMPESYLVAQCEQATSPLDAIQRFTNLTKFNPMQSVIIEAGSRPADAPSCAPAADAPSYQAVGTSRIMHRDLNTLTLDVDASRDSWLVVLDSWDAGWKGTVDGKPVNILPGNYAFRTLPIAAGRHTVQMEYSPRSFVVGRDITGGTLSVMVIAVAVMMFRAIRRQHGRKR